jgi:AraC-like DNA-binding protein
MASVAGTGPHRLSMIGGDSDHFPGIAGSCQRAIIDSEVRRAGPGLSAVWHTHSAVEANLVIAGRGVYFLDNAQYDLSPGVLVWLLPNQSHRLMPGPDLTMWVLTCSDDRCERDLLEDVAAHPHRVLARDDAIALDRLFSHISQDADEPRLYRSAIDYALRSARHVSISGAEAPRKPLHPAVITALRVLRDWPDVPSAAALAAKCGVSQDYLRELLVEQTGRGFVEWRNRSRLERFQILYPQSGDLLTAALAAGFGSYAQFHRVFIDLVGVTPGEWVKGSANTGPPVTDFSPTVERASSRMIWYPLVELVLPEIGRWLDPGFAEALAVDGGPEPPPIESAVFASYDLRRYETDLVRGVAETDLAGAQLLEEAFRRSDLFAAYSYHLSQCGYFGLNDLAVFITAHLAIAWSGANRRSPPGKARMDRLRDRVRNALGTRSRLANEAGVEDRQRMAAAICAQGYIMRSALIAASASGKSDIKDRVVAGVRATTLETYGWDPAGAELPG